MSQEVMSKERVKQITDRLYEHCDCSFSADILAFRASLEALRAELEAAKSDPHALAIGNALIIAQQRAAQAEAGAITMNDAAEMLWVMLANVSGGDWTKQTAEWQDGAAKWRNHYFVARTDALKTAFLARHKRMEEALKEIAGCETGMGVHRACCARGQNIATKALREDAS